MYAHVILLIVHSDSAFAFVSFLLSRAPGKKR